MAAFKNKNNGTWYVQFRYTDWKGERQQKLKRGFATKKEALAWEREFLMQKQADIDMTFESFVELYEKDVKPKLKLNTWLTKESIIKKKILPYFAKRKLSEITAKDRRPQSRRGKPGVQQPVPGVPVQNRPADGRTARAAKAQPRPSGRTA